MTGELRLDGVFGYVEETRMDDRVRGHLRLEGRCVAYVRSDDMTTAEMRDARILAALLLALECEDEARALKPKLPPTLRKKSRKRGVK